MNRLYFVLCLISLFVFAFGLGMAAVVYEAPAFLVVREAGLAINALHNAGFGFAPPPSQFDRIDNGVGATTVFAHSSVPSGELILVSGGPDYHPEIHEAGCLAWLMDRQGEIVHYWKHDPQVWGEMTRVVRLPGVSYERPIGIHLYPDGGLLASFHGHQTYPYAVGLARFDRDSRLLWKKECLAHHWFCVAPDGRIFTPAMKVTDGPQPLGATSVSIESADGKIYDNQILVLDPNGNTLQEIPLLECLMNSGLLGLIWNWQGERIGSTIRTSDPTHLNAVEYVDEELAARYDWLEAGDLLVSMRNINAVGVIDPDERKFKWITSGTAVRQHSPKFYEDGILILDNLGGPRETGGTQLVKVDLERRLPEAVFPRPNQPLPEACRVPLAGHLDLSEDCSRVLLTQSQRAAIWEIELASGRVLWEYLYVHPVSDSDLDRPKDDSGQILTAKYVDTPSFEFNRKRQEPE